MRFAYLAVPLLCAVFGAARAEEPYEPPAMAGTVVVVPSRDEQREEQAAARALAERREEMIHECMDNHGSEIDCVRETDTELRAEGLPWRNRVIRASPFR
jgi:hypothetical protein